MLEKLLAPLIRKEAIRLLKDHLLEISPDNKYILFLPESFDEEDLRLITEYIADCGVIMAIIKSDNVKFVSVS